MNCRWCVFFSLVGILVLGIGRGVYEAQALTLDSYSFTQKVKVRVMSDISHSSIVESEGGIYGYWTPKWVFSWDRLSLVLSPKVWFFRGVGLDEVWDVDTLWDSSAVVLERDRMRLSVGWQKVTWGKLDKIEFLDVVNPYDMRWFYLWEKEDRKESLFSVHWQLDNDDWWFDLIVVPAFSPNRYLYFNSDWAYFGRVKEIFSGYSQVQEVEVKTPSWVDAWSLHNSELFMRWGKNSGELDFDLYFFYGYNRVPGLGGERSVKKFLFSPSVQTLIPFLSTSPEQRELTEVYRRDITLGLDFETCIGDWGIRGEIGYSRDVPLIRDDFSLVFKDELGIGVGVDYSSITNWYFNTQVIWQMVPHYVGLWGQERNSFVWINNLRKDMLDGDLMLDIDFVIRFPYKDWMFNPEISYRMGRSCKLVLGLELFDGGKTLLLGAKRKNDRVYVGMDFYF